MMKQITEHQARQLAILIHQLRPDWDTPGIFKKLGEVVDRGDAVTVAIASLLVAADPKADTPQMIKFSTAWGRARTALEYTPTPPRDTTPDPEAKDKKPMPKDFRAMRQEAIEAHRATNPTPAQTRAALRNEILEAQAEIDHIDHNTRNGQNGENL